jgi:2-polyprenyl-3-methyl-5-hydroxy-6-metoxy-1,4-benzoquinol methylase
MRREEVIVRYVAGRDVLDIGGVDHSAFAQKSENGEWLHSIIRNSARSCLGIDILEDRVRELHEHGYQFLVANSEALPFQNAFDVIVAGELVEHVYNMGLTLDSAWRALRPAGRLIITTPNNYALSKVLYALLPGREVCHPEHTCYYSLQTLSYIVSKHGFRIIEQHGLGRRAKYSLLTKVYDATSRWRPILGEVLVHVFERVPKQSKYSGKW